MTRVVARAERVVEYSMPGVHDSRLEVEMFQIMDEAAGKDDAALVFSNREVTKGKAISSLHLVDDHDPTCGKEARRCVDG